MKKLNLFLVLMLTAGCSASRESAMEKQVRQSSGYAGITTGFDSITVVSAINALTRLSVDSPEIILLTSEGVEAVKLRASRVEAKAEVKCEDSVTSVSAAAATNESRDSVAVSELKHSEIQAVSAVNHTLRNIMLLMLLSMTIIYIAKHR